MKFAIGSTKAGLTLKKEIIDYLEKLNYQVDDLGMKAGGGICPYYKSAAIVAGAVSEGKYEKAIIICGTGAGSVIVANKFKGVYAVHASSEYEASKAKIINNANVLVLAEWITPPQHAKEMIAAWLNAEFGQGFEPEWVDFLRDGVEQVKKIENKNLK
ncbi:MAG: RpiB/LacA/LacB family sugar-phosphate isomerase [Actinobacteria bacterium]|nr:RpiB/LacA/LacB family sugar-phosphate isomerase [Actinomycetota bacterium]